MSLKSSSGRDLAVFNGWSTAAGAVYRLQVPNTCSLCPGRSFSTVDRWSKCYVSWYFPTFVMSLWEVRCNHTVCCSSWTTRWATLSFDFNLTWNSSFRPISWTCWCCQAALLWCLLYCNQPSTRSHSDHPPHRCSHGHHDRHFSPFPLFLYVIGATASQDCHRCLSPDRCHFADCFNLKYSHQAYSYRHTSYFYFHFLPFQPDPGMTHTKPTLLGSHTNHTERLGQPLCELGKIPI